VVGFIGDDDNLFAERMLEDGYYPENLPPVFKITNFHEAALGPLTSGEYITDKTTESCKLNSSKRGGKRRIFSLPNPIFMVDAATFFTKYKTEIDEHLCSSDSSSYPTYSSDVRKRPITIESFPQFHRRRRKELAESRYVIKTDISRFYHSIYTHALPWALHGKSVSKKDRKTDSAAVFGNRLDWLLRQSQDGQTVGIPVGPDFSRIISEIVGVAIDNKFRTMHKSIVPMLRLVDDIYIGSDNIDDAHAFLSSINDSIRAFELDINESKTQILNASSDIEPYWPVELRREIERFGEAEGSSKKADFVYFLDELLRLTNVQGDDAIIKFAVRQFDKKNLWIKYWDLLEPFLIRVAINFPHSWDYVARVVAWRHRIYGVKAAKWRSVVHRSISQHIKSGSDSEILWALWLLKELSQDLESEALDVIINKSSPLVCLLALDVHKTAKSDYKIPKQLILDRLGDSPMMGSNWLFAFEADRQFDLKIKTKNLQGNGFFKQLYDDDVSFYFGEAVPSVFEDVEDEKTVKIAIEAPVTGYDDDDVEDYDDDEENDEDDFDQL